MANTKKSSAPASSTKPAAKKSSAKAATGSKSLKSKSAPVKSASGVKKTIVKKSSAVAAKKEKIADPRISSAPRNFGIGCAVQPKRDLSRFVRWPKYVRIQRQTAILKKRLKVPPAVNQFRQTMDRNGARQTLRLLCKMRPETKVEKRTRLRAEAQRLVEAKKSGEAVDAASRASSKPYVVKYGINHVTALIESRKARLVVIAHDVDPIEIVVCLPALCRKMGVPYVIIKGKSRLGAVVHKRTATALAITEVHPSQEKDLSALIQMANSQFNDKFDHIRRQWGGGIMGRKSVDRVNKIKRAIAKESAGLRK